MMPDRPDHVAAAGLCAYRIDPEAAINKLIEKCDGPRPTG
jgi:hypothetical protein